MPNDLVRLQILIRLFSAMPREEALRALNYLVSRFGGRDE